MLGSVEAWHLNTLAAVIVTSFVLFQIWTLFAARPVHSHRKEKRAVSTEPKSAEGRKVETADKQVCFGHCQFYYWNNFPYEN